MGPSRGLFVVCTLHQRCAHVRALSAKFGRVYPPNHTILNLRHQVLLAWRSGTLPARPPSGVDNWSTDVVPAGYYRKNWGTERVPPKGRRYSTPSG